MVSQYQDFLHTDTSLHFFYTTMERNPIGFAEVVVRIPLFEGDKIQHDGQDDLNNSFDWFEFAQPGIKGDKLATCRRKVTVQHVKIIEA